MVGSGRSRSRLVDTPSGGCQTVERPAVDGYNLALGSLSRHDIIPLCTLSASPEFDVL